MEIIRQLMIALQGIPAAAIIIFLIVSVVIAVELWRLRPQRKRPLIPTPPDAPPGPSPIPAGEQPVPAIPANFQPLNSQQILILIVLLLVVVAIPAGVILYQKIRLPPPSPVPTALPTQTPTLRPTIRPTPVVTFTPTLSPATPSALPTKKPVITPSPAPTEKAVESASPSGLPQVKKPGALPGAGTPILLLPLLAGGGLLALGIRKLNQKLEGDSKN